MDFSDNESLLKAIAKDLEKVQRAVSNDIVGNVKQNVKRIVYDPYSPTKYKRRNWANNTDEGSRGFWSSWDDEESLDNAGSLNPTKIWSNPGFMALDGENYVHGNPSGADRTAIMARAIAEGTDYDFSMENSAADLQSQIDKFDSEKHKNYGEDKKKEREKRLREKNEAKKGWWQSPRDYWAPSLEYLGGGHLNVVSYKALETAFGSGNIKRI
jgi:hypothetical protein